MIERLLIVGLLFIIGYALYTYCSNRQICRLKSMNAEEDPILRNLKPGIPTIVYFTTPNCMPCRTQQQPALAKVAQTMGSESIQIITVDSMQDPVSADRWGVFSAPTTFILDNQGKTTAVNYGVADAEKLKRQLSLS